MSDKKIEGQNDAILSALLKLTEAVDGLSKPVVAVEAEVGEIKKEAPKQNKILEKIKSINEKDSEVTQKFENVASTNLKISEARLKLQESEKDITPTRFKEMVDSLNKLEEIANKGTATDKEVSDALSEAGKVNDRLANLQEQGNKNLEAAINSDQTLNGLKLLNQTLSQQSDFQKANADAFNVEKQIKKLEGFMGRNADENTKQLRDAYTEASTNLEAAIKSKDDKAAEIAKRQLEEIMKGAQTEEDRREAKKLAELQAGSMFKIGDKLEGLGDKMDKMGLAAKGGFLAGIAGLFLMFTNPEKFREILLNVMTAVESSFDAIMKFISGDFSGAAAAMEGHWGTISAMLGSLAFIFFPKFISIVGGGLKTFQKVIRAANIFRVFMMTKFIAPMITGLGTIGASLGLAAGSMSAILVPALIIVAILGGLLWGFNKLRESLGPGASIMDTLKVAMLYFLDFLSMIVNGITFIPRKIIGFLGPRLLKWIMGDDFDTSMFDSISEGLDTNRGARAREEIRLENERAEAQRQMEEAEAGPDNIEIPANMSAEEISALQGTNTDLQLDTQRGPAPQVNAPTIATQNSDNSSSSTTIINPMISPASYALGDLGGR